MHPRWAPIERARSIPTATMSLTPRPVQWGPLGTPTGMGPFPYITALRIRVSARDTAGRTLVYQESKELVILLGAGTFELQSSPWQIGPSRTFPQAASAKNADQCDHRACADAESVRNDIPRAPCPQAILKVRPPNSLDYRARYDVPAYWNNVFLLQTRARKKGQGNIYWPRFHKT